MTIRDEFKSHLLNQQGIDKSIAIAEKYSDLLNDLDALVRSCPANAREASLMRTTLQDSSFWARRALALHPAHQSEQPLVRSDEPTQQTKP